MGKFVKSERPRHDTVHSTHLYPMHFLHRFEDAEGGLKCSSNSYGFCEGAKAYEVRTTLLLSPWTRSYKDMAENCLWLHLVEDK